MAISKVTLNGVTQMDVTNDTVIANHLLDGDTATGADGERLTGTLEVNVVVDPTLSNTGEAADAKVTGDEIRSLKNLIKAIDSTKEIGLTTLSGTVNVNGATAEQDGDKVVVYGTTSGGRTVLCLNGQTWGAKTTTGTFEQTVPAGTYLVHYSASGNQPSYDSPSFPGVAVTSSTFSNSTYYWDGDVFTTNVPVMVGLFVPGWKTYGTSDNPSYFEIGLTEYDQVPEPPSTNGTYVLQCVVSSGTKTYSWVTA